MLRCSIRSSRISTPRGEVVLAGFYSERMSFAFPPAFMKEARIRVAAEWQPEDIHARQEADRAGPALARRSHHPSVHGGRGGRRLPHQPSPIVPV